MIENKIVLPCGNAGSGFELVNIHELMRFELCHTFGGVTVTTGHGSWVDSEGTIYNEPVAIYVVAMDDVRKILDFKNIAHKYAKLAKQKAVYYVIDKKVYIDDLVYTNEAEKLSEYGLI